MRRVVHLNPKNVEALARLYWRSISQCDWPRSTMYWTQLEPHLREQLASDNPMSIDPWAAMSLPISPADHVTLARRFTKGYAQRGEKLRTAGPPKLPPPRRPGRIRVGYLSHYFKHCALTQLMGSVFRLHDRERFEIFGYADAADDGSLRRKNLERDFEHFTCVVDMSVTEASQRIAADQLDILIAIEQFTQGCRPDIAAQRPAPILISHMLATTSGASYLDYFITDRNATPGEHELGFSEQLIYLPDSYLPTNYDIPIAERTPTRAECGLPENGFVYCCFNNSYKINPEIFDVWMQILRETPGSVLWVFFREPEVCDNLKREAQARGIALERLVFAEQRDHPEHLARHRLADLFLDTPLVNAITTAIDSLLVGVPVLTCPGERFSQRACSSLVIAAGLPEFVVPNLESYRLKAIEMARALKNSRKSKLGWLKRVGRATFSTRCNMSKIWKRLWSNCTAHGKKPRNSYR